MPRHDDLSVGVDAEQFVTTFRHAIELLGNEPPMLSRRRRAKVIEVEVIDGDVPRERHYDLSPLRTRAEVFIYCIEVARQQGWDELEVPH
jgi:hypothetical protein